MQFRGSRFVAALLAASMVTSVVAPAAQAAVNVERQSDENPMREVAKSIMWGAIGGLMIGGAIALGTDDSDNDDQYVRWGVVGGTAVGLGMGLWFVSRRPQPSALLEFNGGEPTAHFVAPRPAPDGSVRLPVVAVRF